MLKMATSDFILLLSGISCLPYTNLLSYFNVHHSKTEVFLFKSISEWTNRNPFFGSHASAINPEIKKFLIQVRISTDKRNLSPTQN